MHMNACTQSNATGFFFSFTILLKFDNQLHEPNISKGLLLYAYYVEIHQNTGL